MNIFVLDKDPKKCAEYHCDKHVIKMILESAQLLSTAHHVCDSSIDKNLLYSKTHINHPCAKWCRESKQNYTWLYKLFCCLLAEYTYRYGKNHKSEKLLIPLATVPNIDRRNRTPAALAMPDKYRTKDVVESYRSYYAHEKKRICKWTKRKMPAWFMKNVMQYLENERTDDNSASAFIAVFNKDFWNILA